MEYNFIKKIKRLNHKCADKSYNCETEVGFIQKIKI